jgi:hypothetical protein
MITTITIPISESSIDAEIDFTYRRGRPAYTPRGEYAPTDPPEAADVEIDGVLIQDVSKGPQKVWVRAPQWFIDVLADDDAVRNQLFIAAEEDGS